MSWKKLFPFVFVLIFASFLALNFFSRQPENYPLLRLAGFLVTIGIGIISSIYVATSYGFKSDHGRAFLLLASGMSLILAGDLVFQLILNSTGSVPLPSLADLAYGLGYLLLLLGFYSEVRIYKVSFRSFDMFSRVIIALFIVLLGGAVLYLEVISPYNPQIPLLANLASVSFGIYDFFLVILAVLILKMTLGFGNGKLFLPWLFILLGVISSMTGDIIYSLTYENYLSSVWPYTMLNMFWVGGYLLASYGLLRIGIIIREAQAQIKKM
jgi:hypothetical protein